MPPTDQRKPTSWVSRFNRSLNWLLVKLKVEEVPHIKRIIVTVVGGTIVLLGAILVVTPLPAALLIPFGLAILGTEYAWARRWLRKARKMAQQAITKTQEIIRPGGSAAPEKHAEQPSAPSARDSSVERAEENDLVGAGTNAGREGSSLRH